MARRPPIERLREISRQEKRRERDPLEFPIPKEAEAESRIVEWPISASVWL